MNLKTKATGGGIALVALLIGGVVIYIKGKKAGEDSNEESELFDDLVKDETEEPTYAVVKYNLFASRIHQAMVNWGTVQEEVLAVIKCMKKPIDFYLLGKAFGDRSKTWPNKWPANKTGNLADWIYFELEDNKPELKKVREHLNNMGVNF